MPGRFGVGIGRDACGRSARLGEQGKKAKSTLLPITLTATCGAALVCVLTAVPSPCTTLVHADAATSMMEALAVTVESDEINILVTLAASGQ